MIDVMIRKYTVYIYVEPNIFNATNLPQFLVLPIQTIGLTIKMEF